MMKFNLYKNMRRFLALSAASIMLAGVAVFPACAETSTEENEIVGVETYISLNDELTTINGEGAEFSSNILTIKEGGTFYLSGTLSDGQIIVDSQEDVEIVLNGVTINNNDGPAIYGKNGDMSIKVQKDSQNYLSDGESYSELDENQEPNACVFSHDRITVKGGGELSVTANYEDGIAGKDQVKINNSILSVTSVDDGIRGKDYVELNGGDVNVTTNGGDAIKSTDGYIIVNDGSYTITATKKGVEAADTLTINGGTINILSCTEGFEGVEVIVNGGDIHINASDDGINASDGTGSAMGMGGGFGGRGMGGMQMTQNTQEGETTPTLPEGFTEGQNPPTPPEGFTKGQNPHEFSQNTAVNENMTPQQGFGRMSKQSSNMQTPPDFSDMSNTAETQQFNNTVQQNNGETSETATTEGLEKKDCSIVINGGYIYIEAKGDGIDSNGKTTFNGGTVIINGPTSNGNSALDSDGEIAYNGGTVLAVGSAGMAEAPRATVSDGYTLNLKNSDIQAGTLVTILNENDEVLVAFKPINNISSIVFSSEQITADTTLYVYSGGEYSGELSADGFAQGGEYTKATLIEEVKITDKTTSAGTASISSDIRQGGGKREMINMAEGQKTTLSE